MAETSAADQVITAKVPEFHSFIDGSGCHASGAAFSTVYPGDGTQLAQVHAATRDEVRQAVGSAREAQSAWAATPPVERAAILRRAADLLVADIDRLSVLVVLDNGKTIGEGRTDVLVAAEHLRAAAGWTAALEGSTLQDDGSQWRMAFRVPVGVVAAIIPFNAPLMFTAQKAGPALAAGNAIVLKAPEQAPLAPPILGEVLTRAGLPAGVIQVLQGSGDVGEALIGDPGVDLISFTGSTAVGRRVMAAASARLTRLLLELGGKSANIVYDDAALDAALSGSLAGIFRNAGQRCFSGSRLLVQDSVADSFLDRLALRAGQIPVGDPFDPVNKVGALISAREAERVQGMIAQAVGAGAVVLAGGGRPEGVHPDGAFLRPTVVEVPAGIGADVDIVTKEVFGPVLTVQRFSDMDDAIKQANDSPFGLAGGCWTSDLRRAVQTARSIRTGYFWINSYGALALDAPVGGFGESGFGRELGRLGHEAYTEIKTVILEPDPDSAPRWF